MISEDEALELWRRALGHPLGLAVRTDHRQNLMARLYQIRARTNDESLYAMQIGMAQEPDWLLIYRKMEPENTKPLQEADLDSL
jgi:hypothetical protein